MGKGSFRRRRVGIFARGPFKAAGLKVFHGYSFRDYQAGKQPAEGA
jgi:hypothetical protein